MTVGEGEVMRAMVLYSADGWMLIFHPETIKHQIMINDKKKTFEFALCSFFAIL